MANCYEYTVYKKENDKLTEITDFDFSDIEVRGEFEEIEYLYLPYPKEDMCTGISIHAFIQELIKITTKFTKVRLVIQPSQSQMTLSQLREFRFPVHCRQLAIRLNH